VAVSGQFLVAAVTLPSLRSGMMGFDESRRKCVAASIDKRVAEIADPTEGPVKQTP
jgi:hypothetical protein